MLDTVIVMEMGMDMITITAMEGYSIPTLMITRKEQSRSFKLSQKANWTEGPESHC
jgi:hypothetical protein